MREAVWPSDGRAGGQGYPNPLEPRGLYDTTNIQDIKVQFGISLLDFVFGVVVTCDAMILPPQG